MIDLFALKPSEKFISQWELSANSNEQPICEIQRANDLEVEGNPVGPTTLFCLVIGTDLTKRLRNLRWKMV